MRAASPQNEQGGRCDVLLLSGSSGAGHIVAARAIEEELEAAAIPTVHRDAYDFLSPVERWTYVDLHGHLAEWLPNPYGALFERGSRSRSLVAAYALVSASGRARLASVLAQLRPRVVLATHALGVQLVGPLHRAHRTFRLAALTPNFCAHAFHISREVDCYCASHPLTVEDLTAAGVHPARITLTGVPLRRQFDRPPSQQEARDALRLPQDRPVIVVSRGGSSAGRETIRLLRDLLAARELERCQIVALLGSVARAVVHDRRSFAGHPRLRVEPFVTEIAPFFAAADVVVGKAAGVTCAEVFSIGRPVVLFAPLRGPESLNVERLVRARAVLDAGREPRAVIRAVDRLLREPQEVRQLTDAARTFVIPQNRLRVLQALQELLAERER